MLTNYPAVRWVLGAQHRGLDDLEIEDLVVEALPDANPEDVEDFMGALQGFGRQAAPLAKQALPGVIQGAKQGAMVGGPWGAVIGAAGGGAASILGGRGGTAAPGAPPAAAAPSAPAASQQAVGDLLALLSRPETMQAMAALLMAQTGRMVPVGATQIPALAFANAISETAARIVESAAGPTDDRAGAYLYDSTGAPRCDIANPADRARLILGGLAEQAVQETDGEPSDDTPLANDADPMQAYLDAVNGRTSHAR